uniref:NADH-ubiquinone oxidoreductase chain 6 n=1 Tax=Triatoma infestans TaxID=30076 RepID=A0A343EQV1_TRIIF|nr:NADH dehydrogenase subunit 6 [Triatoma infestans]ASK39799.1 NADH dehydrogenase subunit 6 [Triatoma infestans]QKY63756.1 NADH dehydrogenase subunit 6 [Triatoma infestans]UOF70717.1 NADH dehydrogenase subunit 6 [Triatoma infestans]
MMSTMLISLITSLTFMMTKHPLSMGLTLIIQTLLIAMMTGMMINMFWFSYILVISMLSGMLVLFIYMASVASNEKFHTSWSMALFIMPFLASSLVLFFIVDQLETSSMWSTMKKSSMSNEQLISLLKLFNPHNMSITILLVSYLFLTMIAVTYVSNVYEGPLRMKS